MTTSELKKLADDARDGLTRLHPSVAVVVLVAQPDPSSSPFAVSTNIVGAGDVETLLKAARVALVGS